MSCRFLSSSCFLPCPLAHSAPAPPSRLRLPLRAARLSERGREGGVATERGAAGEAKRDERSGVEWSALRWQNGKERGSEEGPNERSGRAVKSDVQQTRRDADRDHRRAAAPPPLLSPHADHTQHSAQGQDSRTTDIHTPQYTVNYTQYLDRPAAAPSHDARGSVRPRIALQRCRRQYVAAMARNHTVGSDSSGDSHRCGRAVH